jgi:hypothetical protein
MLKSTVGQWQQALQWLSFSPQSQQLLASPFSQSLFPPFPLPPEIDKIIFQIFISSNSNIGPIIDRIIFQLCSTTSAQMYQSTEALSIWVSGTHQVIQILACKIIFFSSILPFIYLFLFHCSVIFGILSLLIWLLFILNYFTFRSRRL